MFPLLLESRSQEYPFSVIPPPQGSYTRGVDPSYACKLLIPVPKVTDDGKRVRAKNQKWKLRMKVGSDGIGVGRGADNCGRVMFLAAIES